MVEGSDFQALLLGFAFEALVSGKRLSRGDKRMVDWIMYGKVQEMKRDGLNKSQIGRHLGIDYKTVLKYRDMSPDEYDIHKPEKSR